MNPETLAEVREQVLQTLKRLKTRSVHVGELRGRIGLERDQHEALHNILESMADEGLLVQMPGGRFRMRPRPKQGTAPARGRTLTPGTRLPDRKTPGNHPAPATKSGDHSGPRPRAAGQEDTERNQEQQEGTERSQDKLARKSANRRTGVLVVNGRGFGFVATTEPGPDVFVPATSLSNAMHGDRVLVQVRPSAKGLEGRVVEIIKRGMEYVSGQLHITAAGAMIEPDDDRIRYPIYLSAPQGNEARPRTGQGVIAKVTHYPERPGDRIEATLVEAFDPRELVAFETRRIMLREGAPEEFSEEALAEARALPAEVPERDKRGRVDLRELDLVTIDPDDARDHDDAVWAEPLKQGGYRVIVAIADVSHYVPEGSALDIDALARGCTIYLPTHAIPMLPPEISSNLASLVPDQDRLALAVEAEVGPQGAVRSYKLLETVMRSQARLTYAGVAKALGLTEAGPEQPQASARLPMLRTLMQVAEVLGNKRRRRGSLEFDLPEAKVKIDPETGRPADVVRSRSDPGIRKAYNMIEELALLANEVVAAELTKRKLPTIYRVHAPPDEDRVAAFAQLATSLGFKLEVEDAQNPKRLSRFLGKIRKTEHAETLSYLLLRAMQQATYDVHNVGHFGLAAKSYVHFTSPIRRYPDLAIHRIVRQLARQERVKTHGLRDKLTEQSAQCSKLERRAMSVEREVVDLYRAMVMQDHVGEVFNATVTGITDHGIFAAIDAPYVDVLCRLSALPRDRWEADAFGLRLTGIHSGRVFALGDRLRVQIEDVSLARRRVTAIPVSEQDNLARVMEGSLPPDAQAPPARRRRRTPRQMRFNEAAKTESPRAKKERRRESRKQGRKSKRKSRRGRA